jgi:hypothetical protein
MHFFSGTALAPASLMQGLKLLLKINGSIGTTKQAAEKLVTRCWCRRLKADSEPETNGLNAGLKASSTENAICGEFFSSL